MRTLHFAFVKDAAKKDKTFVDEFSGTKFNYSYDNAVALFPTTSTIQNKKLVLLEEKYTCDEGKKTGSYKKGAIYNIEGMASSKVEDIAQSGKKLVELEQIVVSKLKGLFKKEREYSVECFDGFFTVTYNSADKRLGRESSSSWLEVYDMEGQKITGFDPKYDLNGKSLIMNSRLIEERVASILQEREMSEMVD